MSIEENISIMTINFYLAIASHGKKMHKYVISVVNQMVQNSQHVIAMDKLSSIVCVHIKHDKLF
jgi:hypothetical protein